MVWQHYQPVMCGLWGVIALAVEATRWWSTIRHHVLPLQVPPPPYLPIHPQTLQPIHPAELPRPPTLPFLLPARLPARIPRLIHLCLPPTPAQVHPHLPEHPRPPTPTRARAPTRAPVPLLSRRRQQPA